MSVTSNETILELLQQHFAAAAIEVSGDGYKYHVKIREPSFADLSIVERHKAVYKVLQAEIASGKLHALSIDAA